MSWAIKKLDEIADFQLGKMLDDKKNKGEPLPYLANLNVRWGEFELNDLRLMRFQTSELERFSLKYGDIVMCEGGEPGRCAIWKEQLPKMMYQKALHRIRPHEGVDHQFLYYAFLHKGKRGGFSPLFTGSTIKHLPKEKLAKVEVEIPDLSEQQRIADLLSKYDDLIENNKRRIELLEESARQLYKEWFVRFRFPGHEHIKIIDGVPEGWEKTTADKTIEILSGGTPKTSVSDYWDGGIGFFTPKDATGTVYVSNTEKTITGLGLEKCASKLYPKNTLFITARGTVGKLNLAQKPMAMNQSCYALVGRDPINQVYLYFAMQAGVQQVKSRAVGAVFDAIIKDTFKVIPFIVPPKILIEEFTDFVEPLLNQIDNLIISTERLVQARDILLPKLMSGEIAV